VVVMLYIFDNTVSIHAPARGATKMRGYALEMSFRFQSTHPRGVRLSEPCKNFSLFLFQSTHPRGVRQGD